MIEECARTALDILNEPLAVIAPQLAMPSADNLTLEPHRSRGLRGCLGIGGLISLRISANFDSFAGSVDGASDDGKSE